MRLLAVMADESAPTSVPCAPANSGDATRIVGVQRMVFTVLLVRRWTQIQPPVVRSIKVFVIDLMYRPLAGHHSPDQTMREIVFAVDHDLNVAVALAHVACDLPKATAPTIDKPAKNSRAGVVVKQLAKLFGRERISVSHAASFHQKVGCDQSRSVCSALCGSST
jgi:hypothetical protein